MKRCYRVSKKVSKEQLSEAAREIMELPFVKSAEFVEEGAFLHVEAEEDRYPEVMGKAVNICNRGAGGAELSFAGFVAE